MVQVEEDTAFHNLSSTVEAMRQKFKKKKTQYGDRQAEVGLILKNEFLFELTFNFRRWRD